jgi:hypothetical protein
MKNVLRPRSFGMLIIALILAASVYGFAAANTVPDTYAGDGNGTISGYTISNVAYGLETSDTDPTDIDQVSFDLGSGMTATGVYVSFDGGTNWVDCSAGVSGSTVTCTGLSINVLGASNLRIIAVE